MSVVVAAAVLVLLLLLTAVAGLCSLRCPTCTGGGGGVCDVTNTSLWRHWLLLAVGCAEDWCYRLDRQLIYLTIDPPKCSLVVWYTVLISAGLFIKSAASRPYNILIQGCRYLLLLECTPDICWAMFWLSRPVKLSTIWLHCHSNQYISLLIKNGSVSWSLFFRVSDYCYHHVWQTISCCHHKSSR